MDDQRLLERACSREGEVEGQDADRAVHADDAFFEEVHEEQAEAVRDDQQHALLAERLLVVLRDLREEAVELALRLRGLLFLGEGAADFLVVDGAQVRDRDPLHEAHVEAFFLEGLDRRVGVEVVERCVRVGYSARSAAWRTPAGLLRPGAGRRGSGLCSAGLSKA